MATTNAFLGINLDLINNPLYEDMSFEAKGLYSLYADRMTCSNYYKLKGIHTYVDEFGVFIIYSNEEAAKIIGVSTKTIGKLRKELLDHNLIFIKRNGLKGFKIYVKDVARTPEDVKLKISWKNYAGELEESKVSSVGKEVTSVSEDSSCTGEKNVLTSTSQESINSRVTRETNTGARSAADCSRIKNNDLALEGLLDRAKDIVGAQVAGKLRVMSAGYYDRAKFILDSIYKAKKQVMTKLRATVIKNFGTDNDNVYSVATNAMRFESNNYLASSIEAALMRITEILYRYGNKESQNVQNIANQNGFIYSFIRGAIVNGTQSYLFENFEIDPENTMDPFCNYIKSSLTF